MLKENFIDKLKVLPQSAKQFIGLIVVTLIVIIAFGILNGIFGQGDDLVERMKLEGAENCRRKKTK
jgi:hypothetical protein